MRYILKTPNLVLSDGASLGEARAARKLIARICEHKENQVNRPSLAVGPGGEGGGGGGGWGWW